MISDVDVEEVRAVGMGEYSGEVEGGGNGKGTCLHLKEDAESELRQLIVSAIKQRVQQRLENSELCTFGYRFCQSPPLWISCQSPRMLHDLFARNLVSPQNINNIIRVSVAATMTSPCWSYSEEILRADEHPHNLILALSRSLFLAVENDD